MGAQVSVRAVSGPERIGALCQACDLDCESRQFESSSRPFWPAQSGDAPCRRGTGLVHAWPCARGNFRRRPRLYSFQTNLGCTTGGGGGMAKGDSGAGCRPGLGIGPNKPGQGLGPANPQAGRRANASKRAAPPGQAMEPGGVNPVG